MISFQKRVKIREKIPRLGNFREKKPLFKYFTIPAAVLLLSACEERPSPVRTTLAPAGSLGNVPVQETFLSANGDYNLTISANGKVALVRTTTRTPTIAGVEAAAAEASGCNAKVVQPTYDAMGNNRNAVIPMGEYNKFGGSMPVVLTCS